MGRWIVAAVAALSLLMVSVASAADQPADASYATPSRLPGRRHGDLIRHRDLTGARALPGGGRTQLVIYRTTDAAGDAVPASGLVTLPRGRKPKGGWPVITWAHGTTGIADACAPSHVSGSPVPLVASWVRAGYAVVQTDYQGLGTAGDHQYLIGASEGHSVLDMVRAARQALPGTLSTNFAIAGHSQGGHAALFAAAEAPRYVPELHLRGTVAFAPASHLDEQIPLTTSLTQPNAGLSTLVAMIAEGVHLANPSLDLGAYLSDVGQALAARTLTDCLGPLGSYATEQRLAPASLFQPQADFKALAKLLDRQDPTNLTIRTRVLVEQGSSDTTVIPLFTDDLAKVLKRRGTPLTYNKVKGADHGAIVSGAGAAGGTRYIEKLLAPR